VESRSALESVVPHDAPVAQLDRACASEAQGRVFESLRAHHFSAIKQRVSEGLPVQRFKARDYVQPSCNLFWVFSFHSGQTGQFSSRAFLYDSLVDAQRNNEPITDFQVRVSAQENFLSDSDGNKLVAKPLCYLGSSGWLFVDGFYRYFFRQLLLIGLGILRLFGFRGL
jgi:hypothetical protein